MELTAWAPERRNAGGRPWDVGVAECRFKLTGAAMVRRSVWRSFALGSFVEITNQLDSTKLQAQIADEQQQRNADGPPLGAFVVNVDFGDREVGARRVGRPAQPASNHHVLKGLRGIPARAWDVDRRAREVARKKFLC